MHHMPMGKVQHRQLTKKEWDALRSELLAALRRMGIKRQGEELLFDLLTKSEVIMLARRIFVAKALLKGEALDAIARRLHLGFATIQQVDRSLEQRLPSYRQVLGADTREKPTGSKIPLDPHSFRGLRARYPAHYAFFNLLLGDPNMYEEE